MFKLFRKYKKHRKWLLALGGVVLMLAFLAPPSVGQMWDSFGAGSAVHARFDDGRTVSVGQWQEVNRELNVLESLARFGQGVHYINEFPTEEHWFLLSTEARDAGLVVDLSARFSQQQVNEIAAEIKQPPQLVDRVFGTLLGVNMMMDMFVNAPRVSDRRYEALARRMFHAATIDAVVIPATPAKDAPEPTDQEIADQMAKYADKAAGEGDMGFGYKVPDRVKIEWLQVPADAVRAIVQGGPGMSNTELRKHWQKNPEQTFPAVEPAATIPDVVRNDLLSTLTRSRLDEIAKFAGDRLRMDRRVLKEEHGFLTLTPDWETRRMPLPTLAQRIQEEFQVDLPAYHAAGNEWLSLDDLYELDGIGEATSDKFGNRPVDLREVVAAAREFGGTGLIPVQEGVEGPVLRGEDGSVYVFRITDTDPAHSPRNVDEVRDKVVADLKKLAAYRELAGRKDEIESLARSNGLLALAMEQDAPVSGNIPVYLNDRLSYLGMGMGGMAFLPMPIGSHRPTIEAIIDHSLALPANVPVEDLTEEQRTFVVPVDDKLSLLAVRITDQRPLTQSEYQQLVEQNAVQQVLHTELLESSEAVQQAFSLEALKKRHNFTLEQPAKVEDDPNAPATPPVK